MSKLTTAIKLSGIALFFVVCALLLMLILPQAGWKALSVQTGSMRPAIKPGDLVLVHRVPLTSLKVGDVITYTNPSNKKQTITHRIISLQGPQLSVKGDANGSADTPISLSAVVGRVSHKVPHAGYAASLILKPPGLFLFLAIFVYLPAVIIVVGEVRRLTDYYKTQQTYLVPWRRQKSIKPKDSRGATAMAAKTLILIVIVIMAVAVPVVHALLKSTATLTGNTISATNPTTNPCNTSGNSTTVTVVSTGGGNVNVSNSNNQNAQTGNATSTNGGSATSGNATNCNNTNINIIVTGH